MDKLFTTGDTHGGVQHGFSCLNGSNFPEGKKLTKDDFVIILGDFGVIWSAMEDGNERYWRKWLEEKPWTTLFIDGNHENFERVNKLPREEKFGGEVGVYSPGHIYHLRRGNVYTINEKTLFVFGGAESYDRSYRKPFVSWWEEEMPTNAEYEFGLSSLDNVNQEVDYVLTHDCPGVMYQKVLSYRDYKPSSITKYFDTLYENLKFSQWHCGHHHIDKIIDKNFYFCYNEVRELV